MIEGIISSIIASILITLCVFFYRRGYLIDFYDRFLQKFPKRKTVPDSDDNRLKRIRNILIRKLISDQSRKGIHFGQFGKSTSNVESAKYQGNPENLSVKPRMYLTFWPGVILKKHNLTPRALRFSIEGVKRLYHNNRIAVRQSLSSGMLPDKQPVMVSFRHTMCGALFLYYQSSWNSITQGVIDLMLDRRNKWQNSDGGWAHSDREVTESDLWGSAYAIQLLHIVIETGEIFPPDLKEKAMQAIHATIKYFRNNWNKSNWSYGGACAEENAVNLFIDIGPILKNYDIDFFNIVKNFFLTWLSPTRDLSETYIAACSGISKERLYARMAYVLFRTEECEDIWRQLFDKAVSNNFEDFISSEMAFLIDMSYEY